MHSDDSTPIDEATIPLRKGEEEVVERKQAHQDSPTLHCSFCGKSQKEVRKLISGPTVYICDECVGLCNDIIGEEIREQEARQLAPLSAQELFSALDDKVVGQQEAKRALVAAVRLQNLGITEPLLERRATRLLLVGPRGCGKTALAKALSSSVQIPIGYGDVGRMTESGYIGEDVEQFVIELLQSADHDVERAQNGILFFDGVEKIRAERPIGAARDISGECVQRELLRILDGMVVNVPPKGRRRHPQQDFIRVSCEAMLMVAAVRLEHRDLPPDAGEGRIRDALAELGLLPELLARFDRVVVLNPLHAEEMASLLTHQRGLLAHVRRVLGALGGSLEYSQSAVRVLATAAADDSDGAWAMARPIHRLLERILTDPSPARAWNLDERAAWELLAGTRRGA